MDAPTWWTEQRFGLVVQNSIAAVPAWAPIGVTLTATASTSGEDGSKGLWKCRPPPRSVGPRRPFRRLRRPADVRTLRRGGVGESGGRRGMTYVEVQARDHDGWCWWDAGHRSHDGRSGPTRRAGGVRGVRRSRPPFHGPVPRRRPERSRPFGRERPRARRAATSAPRATFGAGARSLSDVPSGPWELRRGLGPSLGTTEPSDPSTNSADSTSSTCSPRSSARRASPAVRRPDQRRRRSRPRRPHGPARRDRGYGTTGISSSEPSRDDVGHPSSGTSCSTACPRDRSAGPWSVRCHRSHLAPSRLGHLRAADALTTHRSRSDTTSTACESSRIDDRSPTSRPRSLPSGSTGSNCRRRRTGHALRADRPGPPAAATAARRCRRRRHRATRRRPLSRPGDRACRCGAARARRRPHDHRRSGGHPLSTRPQRGSSTCV